MTNGHERLQAAYVSLEGLSVGDAFGRHAALAPSPDPWRYSDDTEMAIAILNVLEEHEEIDQDALAQAFSRRFQNDPERGYGAGTYWLLHQIGEGRDWRSVSREVFRGQGSLGNGAAMRAGPIGAYFAGNLPEVVQQARRSAEVTHAHPDGHAGAIAVAVAAAYARSRAEPAPSPAHLFDVVLECTPDGPTREGIQTAASLPPAEPLEAARILGDGTLIRASDTVPFSLWCARRHWNSYEAALRAALAGCERNDADRDTICAIVGSIVVLTTGVESIPAEWRSNREPLMM